MKKQWALKINNLSKRFPGVQALDNISLQIPRGEVHAVVGENGAGKSTLMKILAGAEKPDTGSIFINGRKLEVFTPQSARKLGIDIIFQEFSLIAHLSAEKNISLGREPNRLGWIVRHREILTAKRLLAEMEADIPINVPVSQLSVGQQQLIEIAKALSLNASTIIMDEPASALSATEREQLFALIAKLRRRNITILYVSHSLDEIFRISDSVSVLKDGRLVFTKATADISADELILAMVGRKLEHVYPPKAKSVGRPLLAVKNLSSGRKLKSVSFNLREGEILGLYGLVGAGRTELCKALFGVLPRKGTIQLHDRKLSHHHPASAIRNGMVFLTEDRKNEGLIMGFSVRENIALPSLKMRATLGVVNKLAERKSVAEICEKLKVKTPSIESDVYYLSGGNQQKVVIGKWLLAAPQVMICDEPTRGVDIGAKMEIYAYLRNLADRGLAVILVSSELPEIIGMSDRILVMRNGSISCEFEIAQTDEASILAAALNKPSDKEASTIPVHSSQPDSKIAKRRPGVSAWLYNADRVVFLTLLCLIGIGIFTSDSFLNKYNLTSILRDAAALGIVAMGQAMVMIGGGLDISVGSIVSLTTILAAMSVNGSDAMIAAGLFTCLAVGLGIGILNGIAVVKLKIAPFIATLGMMSIVHGSVLLVAHGPVGSVGKIFRSLSRGSVGPFPAALVIVLLVFAGAAVVMNKSVYGRYLSATGANSEVARLSGIPVQRVIFSSYILSALGAVLAGLYLTSRMGMGDPLVGRGFEMDSIIAVLIGGVPFGGGRGNIFGVIAGVLFLAVLGNLLNMWNLHSWYHQIVKAVILLLAISVYKQDGP